MEEPNLVSALESFRKYFIHKLKSLTELKFILYGDNMFSEMDWSKDEQLQLI